MRMPPQTKIHPPPFDCRGAQMSAMAWRPVSITRTVSASFPAAWRALLKGRTGVSKGRVAQRRAGTAVRGRSLT